jgi:hypothetical protein
MSIRYLRVEEHLSPDDIEQPQLYILRLLHTTALRYLAADKELNAKYAGGNICSVFCQKRSELNTGMTPIVDLARIYASSEGMAAVNTILLLQQCSGIKSLTKASAENVIDAYAFLTSVRLEHQGKLLRNKLFVDSYIDPKHIWTLEREHLKDAFKVIKSMQDYRQSAVL